MRAMPPQRIQWMLALAGWTLFAWTNRIRNVVVDDELTDVGRAWRLGVSVAFVAAAVGVVGLVLAARRPGAIGGAIGVALDRLATGLAVIGSAWWLVRGIQILVGDWDLGFKVVHTVLAVVTIGLSVMVVLTGDRGRRGRFGGAPTSAGGAQEAPTGSEGYASGRHG